MEPNPTATAPVGEIKEMNHPGDDLQAFQVKEQLKKKKVYKTVCLKSPSFPRHFWVAWFDLFPLHSLA